MSSQTAAQVAAQLTAHDALAAHVEAELQRDPEDLANPLQPVAAAASFTVVALLPMLAILLPPVTFRVPVTLVAVLAAIVGRCGQCPHRR